MRVVADSRRGHIALVRESETVVSWVDLGPVLQIWQTGSGVEMPPEIARDLGVALVAWADKKATRGDSHG